MVEQLTSPLVASEKIELLKSKIRDIADFPKPGIVFKDLTTLLKDADAFSCVIDVLSDHFRTLKPDYIAGIEARGFILAPVIAHKIGVGFIPIRKAGKLPYRVVKETYNLEYGTDTVEVHEDAVDKGAKSSAYRRSSRHRRHCTCCLQFAHKSRRRRYQHRLRG